MADSWGGRRATQALALIKAEGRRHGSPCVICSQAIDYTLTHPHPDSCSVQHVRSRKARPDLIWDRDNWAPAHLVCNQSAGDGLRGDPYDLGLTSW